jgi:drug/metabolite transporter (DMT)-like permease
MIVLCAIWGLQQVVIKVAAGDVAPVVQAAGRSGIAALAMALLITWRGGWRDLDRRTLGPGLLAGLLFTGEFLFIALGLRYTTASHMAVFLYTAPIFSALGLHLLLPSERLGTAQWLGIAVCFGGIASAFGPGLHGGDAQMLLGDAFGLLAGLSYGLTTVVIRGSNLSEAPAGLTLFYQLIVAFVALLGFAAALGQLGEVKLTMLGVGSVLFQGVIVSFLSYFAWFWLLRRYLASHMAALAFMTPLFGVAFGVLLLHEALSLNFAVGAGLVLLGIALVNGDALLRRRARSVGGA